MNAQPGCPIWWARDGLAARQIVTATAEHFGYQLDQILQHRRSQSLDHARQVAMYLVRERTALSYPEIGRLFARDHSTVLHAHNKIQRLLPKWVGLAVSVEIITKHIEAAA